jgi:hypothetical protein
MGNTPSSKSAETEFENFYDVVDYIATYYIMTMDFKSLSKLSDKDYCDKLVIITSDILQRYLNEQQITYLEQRVKDGVEVNAINNEKFVFITKDVLEGLDLANDTRTGIKKKIKKQRVCLGIAKFYVKVAHVFAAIVMTINPVYSYRDSVTGLTMQTSLLDRDTIPKGTEKKVLKLNICDDRIRALRNNETLDEETGEASVEPEICSINMTESGSEKTLADEPGISELMQLYFDKFDEKTGTFTAMTPETAELFQKDLKEFYTAFTGNSTMPPEITRFSDIKLRDYMPNCIPPDGKLRSKVQISQKSPLFVAYAQNIKKMIQNAADNQSKLLDIINKLFDYTIDPKTGKRIIRVNPTLTEETLQQNVEKTRKLISTLYLKCQADFEEGVKLMNAIVESKEVVILPRQIKVLNDESDKLVKSAAVLGVASDMSEPKLELGEIPGDNSSLPLEPPLEPPVESSLEPPLESSLEPPLDSSLEPPLESSSLDSSLDSSSLEPPLESSLDKEEKNIKSGLGLGTYDNGLGLTTPDNGLDLTTYDNGLDLPPPDNGLDLTTYDNGLDLPPPDVSKSLPQAAGKRKYTRKNGRKRSRRNV